VPGKSTIEHKGEKRAVGKVLEKENDRRTEDNRSSAIPLKGVRLRGKERREQVCQEVGKGSQIRIRPFGPRRACNELPAHLSERRLEKGKKKDSGKDLSP